jgi:hypothetical protein
MKIINNEIVFNFVKHFLVNIDYWYFIPYLVLPVPIYYKHLIFNDFLVHKETDNKKNMNYYFLFLIKVIK